MFQFSRQLITYTVAEIVTRTDTENPVGMFSYFPEGKKYGVGVKREEGGENKDKEGGGWKGRGA